MIIGAVTGTTSRREQGYSGAKRGHRAYIMEAHFTSYNSRVTKWQKG